MEKFFTQVNMHAMGLLCGFIGIIGSAIVEYAPVSIPGISAAGVGVGGTVAAVMFFGLALAFRGL